MEIVPIISEFVKTYSLGIEEHYTGNTIIYNNTTKTFIYYYYVSYTRVYVIDGKGKNTELPQINEKIRVLYYLENAKAMNFLKYTSAWIKKDNKTLFNLNDSFYYDLYALINKKRGLKSDLVQLYKHYSKGLVL